MPARPIPHDRLAGLAEHMDGLSAAEAAARLARHGFNDIVVAPPSTWRDIVRDTLSDPMIWFLAGVSTLFAVLGDWAEATVLLAALVPLVGMDAWLHRRTQASTQGLATRLASTARVMRDGVARSLAVREAVPGDLVEVVAGEPFPADGIVVAGDGLQVDESTLTGESMPVRKMRLSAGWSTQPAADLGHWGFAGTRLLTGVARLRLVSTGGETLYGEIVRSALSGRHGITPLQEAVARLVSVMLAAAVVLCLLLGAIRLWQGHGLLDAFISAVTLAVAALPEEFPVVLTFFLGVGVYRLARRQALVRRAVAVEDIGRVTCICSDKTGTLTEGRLVLAHTVPEKGASAAALLALASCAARADSSDPLDVALLAAAGAKTPAGDARLATFPFTEDRRRETAIIAQTDGTRLAAVKGAPETVLALCTGLDEEGTAAWRHEIAELAGSGHKVIAVASQVLGASAGPHDEPVSGYRFAGLLAFEDPVRDGVVAAVRQCREGGIRVIMVTGDHPLTAGAVARSIGLGGGKPVVALAETLEADGSLDGAGTLADVDVVARAAPAQKLRLVEALQRAGETVAVTGDGVNDVPALKAASIGIAMGERGTQSAREVAAIVLLDDNFRTIVRAVAEGRQLFANLQLAFAYLLMVHIPLVTSAAFIPLTDSPLLYLPVHIVWLELVIHPIAMLVFQDIPAAARLAPRGRDGPTHVFHPVSWLVICSAGLLLAIMICGAFLLAAGEAGAGAGHVEHARGLAISMLIAASAGLTAGLGGLTTRLALAVTAASLASMILLVQVEPLARLMHVEPLHGQDWLMVAVGAGIAALLGTAARASIADGREARD